MTLGGCLLEEHHSPALWTPSGRSSGPAPPAWRCLDSAFWRSFAPARWAAPGWSGFDVASVSGIVVLQTGLGCCCCCSAAAVAVAAASPALYCWPAPGWFLRRCWYHHRVASWPLPRRPDPGRALRSVPGLVLLRPACTSEPPCDPGAPPRHLSSLHTQTSTTGQLWPLTLQFTVEAKQTWLDIFNHTHAQHYQEVYFRKIVVQLKICTCINASACKKFQNRDCSSHWQRDQHSMHTLQPAP